MSESTSPEREPTIFQGNIPATGLQLVEALEKKVLEPIVDISDLPDESSRLSFAYEIGRRSIVKDLLRGLKDAKRRREEP